jgi:hypothetical protein
MYTYFDAVESLIVSSYGGAQDAEQRDIRTAIHRAYDELTTLRDWNYYQTHGRVITDAPYQTGTVSYNTSTRALTLSGGTWPAWAEYGHVRVGTRIASVQTRVSGTVLTLKSGVTFPETLTAQPYVIYRILYPLPSDFRNLDEPTSEYNWSSGLYVSPDEALKIERVARSTGLPYHWTVLPDPDGSGWVLKLIGYPTRVETVDFMYRRSARPIKYSGHESAARFSSVTVQDEGADLGWVAPIPAAPSDCVGSVVRFGSAASVFPGSIESLTPYDAEGVVLTRNGDRGLTTHRMSAS